MFQCPNCEDEVTKVPTTSRHAAPRCRRDGRAVRAGRSVGTALRPPIGPDDLIDFGLTLGVTDTLVEVLTAEATADR